MYFTFLGWRYLVLDVIFNNTNVFQWYRGVQCYLWRKPVYQEKTMTCLQSHNVVSSKPRYVRDSKFTFLELYPLKMLEANLCRFSLSFVYTCIVVDDLDIKRGFGIPLSGLTPPHLCAYPKSGPRFPMSYVVSFCVQWVNVCCDCPLCWYWWNCLPFLFKLNFHNFTGYMHNALKLKPNITLVEQKLRTLQENMKSECIPGC
jgi:hypothetical protein